MISTRIARIGAATAALMAVGVAGAAAASADSGDGQEACNRYEICFSKHWDNYRYQKHFWYSGSHANYVWWDRSEHKATTSYVQNSASALANRDGSCDVKVVNDRGIFPDSTITIPNYPGSVAWRYLDHLNDANDRHERTNCG